MAVISQGVQQKISLDLYDKKIIFYLSQNSREPISSLAKKLRSSPQKIKYKIERLKKEILEPGIFMNFNTLNIQSYIIYLKKCDAETVKTLMNSNEIYFFMQCIGQFQWVLNVVTNNINTFCEHYLSEQHFEIRPILHSIPDDYNPFNLAIKPNELKKDTLLELNTLDYKLLICLIKNPTDHILRISQKTNIDRKTIRERIRRYEQSNLIQKFRYGINIFKIGYLVYTLEIETIPRMKKQILEFIRKNKYSGFIFESYNHYTMHFLPPSHNDLMKFIEDIRTFDPTTNIEVVQNTEFFKVQLVPDSVIEILQKRIR